MTQTATGKYDNPTGERNNPAGECNNPAGRYNKLYSPYMVIVLRIIIGALFVVSGFSKAVDPWGFIFKIEDYFAAWGMTEPRTITLVIAMALSTYELVTGFMLMTGCFKRLSPWLLMLSMVFMLPLTAYIWIANPVDDCGCFGEMFKLSNAATFFKNVVIVAALVYLCKYNARLQRGVYRPALQWLVLVVVMLYSIVIGLYGYNIQPLVDFRPYPVGSNLYSILNPGNEDGMSEILMVYEKEGKEETFAVDNLPDSTWTFVRREDNVAEMSNEAAFSIYDVDGDDITEFVISDEGEQLLLVIPEANRVDISGTYAINEMDKAINKEDGSMVALIAATPDGIGKWIDISMADYPCYIAEDTSLKQLARGHMSLVYIKDGVIKWKRILSAFDFATIDALSNGELTIDDIEIDDKGNFKIITILTIGLLVFIALFQEFILRIIPKKQKKQLTLQSEKPGGEKSPVEVSVTEAESADRADCGEYMASDAADTGNISDSQ